MEGGASQDVAAPHDGLIGVVLQIALPSGQEARVVQRRVVAAPGKKVVTQKVTAGDQAACLIHQRPETIRIADTPVFVTGKVDHTVHRQAAKLGQVRRIQLVSRHISSPEATFRPERTVAQARPTVTKLAHSYRINQLQKSELSAS